MLLLFGAIVTYHLIHKVNVTISSTLVCSIVMKYIKGCSNFIH